MKGPQEKPENFYSMNNIYICEEDYTCISIVCDSLNKTFISKTHNNEFWPFAKTLRGKSINK